MYCHRCFPPHTEKQRYIFTDDVNGVQGQGHLVEEEPEEERDHDGDAGGGVGKKPAGLLDKGHLSVG